MTFLVKYLPRKALSRWVGFFMHIPGPWSGVLIWIFAKVYKINMAESEKPMWAYPSLGEFFIRKLKPNFRSLAETWMVHPADALITECGEIKKGLLIQAKGHSYGIEKFIEDPLALEKYEGGLFLTFYLCPTDYHRVHSPVNGLIRSVTYMSGDLWPVNSWSVRNIPQLFRKNERVYVEIATELGPVGVVFVGATNVGSIEVKSYPEMKTNFGRDPHKKIFEIPHEAKKGEELGLFRMGSTIVLLVGPEIREKCKFLAGSGTQSKVRGALATLQS